MPESRPEGGAAAGGALLVLVPDEAVPLGTRAAGELSVAFLRAAVTSVVPVLDCVAAVNGISRDIDQQL